MITINEGLRRVRSGDMTPDRFFRESWEGWRKLAAQFARDLPAWFSKEDVVAELVAKACQAMGEYSADHPRAPAFEVYVVYVATAYLQKRTMSVRKVSRPNKARKTYGPSRYERPISSYADAGEGPGEADEHGERVLARVATRAAQEEQAHRSQVFSRAWDASREARVRIALAAVYEADGVEGAARALYADARARLECEIGSPREALGLAREAAGEVAKVLEAESKVA